MGTSWPAPYDLDGNGIKCQGSDEVSTSATCLHICMFFSYSNLYFYLLFF